MAEEKVAIDKEILEKISSEDAKEISMLELKGVLPNVKKRDGDLVAILNDDCWLNILGRLDAWDLFNLYSLCSRFKRLAKEALRNLCHRRIDVNLLDLLRKCPYDLHQDMYRVMGEIPSYGLSLADPMFDRHNRVDPEEMVKVLRHFKSIKKIAYVAWFDRPVYPDARNFYLVGHLGQLKQIEALHVELYLSRDCQKILPAPFPTFSHLVRLQISTDSGQVLKNFLKTMGQQLKELIVALPMQEYTVFMSGRPSTSPFELLSSMSRLIELEELVFHSDFPKDPWESKHLDKICKLKKLRVVDLDMSCPNQVLRVIEAMPKLAQFTNRYLKSEEEFKGVALKYLKEQGRVITFNGKQYPAQ